MKGTLERENGKEQSNTLQHVPGTHGGKKSRRQKEKEKKQKAAPTIQYFNITKIKPSKAVLSWKA